MKTIKGMTLIEMIIAIVLMGIAMVAFTSFLVPQIRDSANSHYQTRAAALGQSFMSQILARGFDHHSDFNGGDVRCGEGEAGSVQARCTGSDHLGAEEGDIANFNDVDDYIGCWFTASSKANCNSSTQHPLSNVLGIPMDTDYKNFRVEIDVRYVTENGAASDAVEDYKRISMTIYPAQTQPLTLSAIRGNY